MAKRTIGQQVDRFFSNLEWRWSLSSSVVTAYFVASAALPAWAVSAMKMFEEYAPLSWVVAGFVGVLLATLAFAVFSWAYGRWVRSKYDRSLYERTGFVDPMAKTFEDKRIFLADFCLPSDPYIAQKTFINCEIVGPANLFLRAGNRVDENLYPHCDAVALSSGASFYNGITLDNCMFRGCSFKRITFMITPEEYETTKSVNWLNWINRPLEQPILPGISDANPTSPNAPPLPPDTEEEKHPQDRPG